MAASDLLDLLAPVVASASAADKAAALVYAETYRPACLPVAQQDEAQAWLAAWVLYDRQRQTSNPVAQPLGAASVKEGQLAVTFGDPASATAAADPAGFRARWKALWSLCGAGSITGGTAYGYCHP